VSMCVGKSVRVFIYLDLVEQEAEGGEGEGEKSGAKSAVKRDLNTIVPFQWENVRGYKIIRAD
jgi:hypothetical protein